MICSSKDGTIKDAALFGAVWRCALRHSMAISVVCPIGQPAYVRCEGWDDRQEPVFILDNQIGVALALAYCAARGDKVEF